MLITVDLTALNTPLQRRKDGAQEAAKIRYDRLLQYLINHHEKNDQQT